MEKLDQRKKITFSKLAFVALTIFVLQPDSLTANSEMVFASDLKKEYQKLLPRESGKKATKVGRKFCEKHLQSTDHEVAAISCLFCTLIGREVSDADLSRVLKQTLAVKYKLSAGHAISCLALSKGAKAEKQLIDLSFHEDESVQNAATVMLAQLPRSKQLEQAIVKLLKEDDDSTYTYYVLGSIRHLRSKIVRDAVITYAQKHIKADKHFNSEAVLDFVLNQSPINQNDLELLLYFNTYSLDSRLHRLYSFFVPKENHATVVKELKKVLANPKTKDLDKRSALEVLSTYKSPDLVTIAGKLVKACTDDCDYYIWPLAAALSEQATQKLLQSTLKHPDSYAKQAAKVLLDFHAASNKDKEVDRFLGMRVTKDGKVNFDAHMLRDKKITMAARAPKGMSDKKLASVLLIDLKNVISLDWHDLTRAMIFRFGSNPKLMAAMLKQRLNGRDILRTWARKNLNKYNCKVFRANVTSDLGFSGNMYAYGDLFYASLRSPCKK